MTIELPALPYATAALAPHLSPEVFEYHYDKHHAAYVRTVNDLVAGTELEHATLDEIVLRSDGKLFNNAAQVWNHNLYWRSMTPGGGGVPSGRVADAISQSFGNFDDFRAQFLAAATHADDVQAMRLEHLFQTPPVGFRHFDQLREIEQGGVAVKEFVAAE